MGRGRPQDSVSNSTTVIGNGNNTQTGAAQGDVSQDMRFGSTPEGGSKIETAQTRLTALSRALDSHADAVADLDRCRAAVALIDGQLRSGEPQRSMLDLALDGLLPAIGTASDVLAVFQALQVAVTALWSTVA
ncbi:hypothetical protein [Streptomyces lutosisoli]|uniref:Uncharacterized protein n=1 Tax=Streptomyces lutosisoli TaxID=2665721 RepID=A0ABW2VL38_9ACTN